MREKPLNLSSQLEIEEQMFSYSKETFFSTVSKAQAEGRESETVYGLQLIRGGISKVAEGLAEWKENADTGKAGRRHTALPYLKRISDETCAYLGLKNAVNALSRDAALLTTARCIGDAIYDEVCFREYEKAEPKAFSLTKKRITSSMEYRQRFKKKQFLGSMLRIAGVRREGWPVADRVQMGKVVIEVIAQATGLFTLKRVTRGEKNTPWVLSPTEGTLKWIEDTTQALSVLSPTYWPMVCPPRPWTSPWDGGYWTGRDDITMVKVRNRRYLKELAEVEMPEVYNAINQAQNTAWRVNAAVLDVAEQAFDKRLSIAKLPVWNDIELPIKPLALQRDHEQVKAWRAEIKAHRKQFSPEEIEAETVPPCAAEQALKDWHAEHGDELGRWKKQASEALSKNRRLGSQRLCCLRTIRMARQFISHERIWFPYKYDFRGRLYAVTAYLSPQDTDLAKGLLTFAEGKPIGLNDACNGIFWLAVHGANTYGFDKVSLEDREAWVLEHSDRIRSVAQDPFGEAQSFWTEADKPWQFLAFCFEWDAALAHGPGFVSTLPIALDGTCNGLQHYSALLRDPVGGKAVNLLPSKQPSDIYAEVARVTREKVKGFLYPNGFKNESKESNEEHERNNWWAKKWLEFGINRKITKRSVMTLPYAATAFTSRSFIEEAIEEAVDAGAPNPFSHKKKCKIREKQGGDPFYYDTDGIFEASMWLQPKLWESIHEVVQAARRAMGFLSASAKVAAREGLPINWRLPDGFYVEQRYPSWKKRFVKTVIDGEIVRLLLQGEKDGMDRKAMASAIAPNFIHSLDALALRKYINLASHEGIKNFALVHDSYGTVAADVEAMTSYIRRAFVDLYANTDPLDLFRKDLESLVSKPETLPPLPTKGDADGNLLDISLVEESDFFFA